MCLQEGKPLTGTSSGFQPSNGLPSLRCTPAQDMRFADSIDMNKDYPSSWAELMDPTKDEPGYPRLMLENRAYQTRVFRKVHLEVGIRQDNIQVSL